MTPADAQRPSINRGHDPKSALRNVLGYGSSCPWLTRRAIKKWTIVSVLLLLCGGAYQWSADWRRRVAVCYWQRRCMTFASPTNQVIYEEGAMSRAPGLVSNPAPFGSFLYRPKPRCWLNMAEDLGWGPSGSGIGSGLAEPLLFLGRRENPRKQERLVVVCAQFMYLHSRFLMGSSNRSVIASNGLGFRFLSITPATLKTRPVERGHGGTGLGPLGPGTLGVSSGKNFRLYAGQADPTDATRFSIRYEIDGKPGVINAKIDDNDWIEFSVDRTGQTSSAPRGSATRK